MLLSGWTRDVIVMITFNLVSAVLELSSTLFAYLLSRHKCLERVSRGCSRLVRGREQLHPSNDSNLSSVMLASSPAPPCSASPPQTPRSAVVPALPLSASAPVTGATPASSTSLPVVNTSSVVLEVEDVYEREEQQHLCRASQVA